MFFFFLWEKKYKYFLWKKKEATNEIVNADMPLNRLLRRDWFAISALNPFIAKQAHFFFYWFLLLHVWEKMLGRLDFILIEFKKNFCKGTIFFFYHSHVEKGKNRGREVRVGVCVFQEQALE